MEKRRWEAVSLKLKQISHAIDWLMSCPNISISLLTRKTKSNQSSQGTTKQSESSQDTTDQTRLNKNMLEDMHNVLTVFCFICKEQKRTNNQCVGPLWAFVRDTLLWAVQRGKRFLKTFFHKSFSSCPTNICKLLYVLGFYLKQDISSSLACWRKFMPQIKQPV